MLQTITSMRFLALILWNLTRDDVNWALTRAFKRITSM
ncbi:hypothetical protein KP509_19G050400 [Ceratopteris richardii]|uniref:Uncharacterized protein n=1 Tax=Ceratopteris richardii TaxID=49495 RepID=A0A8T2SNT9_CERRI|nr:hypothetical protein KP509_19G050400 [Ceratopteris richardii]